MSNRIEITEEDIYKFVFNPETLSEEKREYLNTNQDRFAKEIKMCIDINSSAARSEEEEITQRIINNLSDKKAVELYPQYLNSEAVNGTKLAASTQLSEKTTNSKSFTDLDSKFLVRVLKTDTSILLYLFTSDKSKTHYKLKVFPSQKVYTINDISQPLEIPEEKVIEKIVVE